MHRSYPHITYIPSTCDFTYFIQGKLYDVLKSHCCYLAFSVLYNLAFILIFNALSVFTVDFTLLSMYIFLKHF